MAETANSRSRSNTQGPVPEMKIKVLGVGGAGNNALDRLVLEGDVEVDLLACNTDVQALASSVASHKIQLGRHVTRGLGAGGDPEVGFAAAEEAANELRETLTGVPLLLVCTGLGGGTGSGATPLIVKIARELGSLVLVCATLPFSFEGKRRGRQAQEALAAIQQYADAVVCFENDRMGELISPESGIHQAFSGADQIIGQCVRSVIDMVNRRGLIHLGFDDLFSALRNHDPRCLFGYGEASGAQRGTKALEQALSNPLMERGSLLSSATNVLINIVGGKDLTLSEVQTLMEELAQHIGDDTQLLFGAAVDAKMDNKLGVTLISSLSARPAPAVPGGLQPAAGRSGFQQPETGPMYAPAMSEGSRPGYGAPVGNTNGGSWPGSTVPIPGGPRPPQHAGAPDPMPAGQSSQNTGEPVIRGRFDKSEPTIVDGEDLDVPTFLRKNLKVR